MQKSNYKVSVLIPVYNVENYIEKCAKSLFNNTIASDCEFIFTNDCTPDSSMEKLKAVIKEYPSLKDNIKIINHEKNMGISVARNEGFDNASGEYLICTDSDDYVEPDYLEALYEEAKKGNYDIVCCAFYETPDYNFPEKAAFQECVKVKFLNSDIKSCLFTILDESVGCYLWNKLIKRDFLQKSGVYFVEELFCIEDMPFMIELLIKNPSLGYLTKPLYHYVKRENSAIHGVHKLKKVENIFLMLKYVKDILIKNKMEWAYEACDRLVFSFKYKLLFCGTNRAQKKCLYMPKELNRFAGEFVKKPFYRMVIRISGFSPFLAYLILHIYYLGKCLLGRVDYKSYIER